MTLSILDVLESVILEANPTISGDRLSWLMFKYAKAMKSHRVRL